MDGRPVMFGFSIGCFFWGIVLVFAAVADRTQSIRMRRRVGICLLGIALLALGGLCVMAGLSMEGS